MCYTFALFNKKTDIMITIAHDLWAIS